MPRFRDREEAGHLLGEEVVRRIGRPSDALILALPRGGVPVGAQVARLLGAPLDVLVVRKLGVPGHEELAMGAIASGGVRVMNEEVLRYLNPSPAVIEAAVAREAKELERRERSYRGSRTPFDAAGRTVILIDDGLATGSTMLAAVRAIRRLQPRRTVVAVPVAAPSTAEAFTAEVDEVICLFTPQPFHAVGLWYENFDQTTDEEVQELLGSDERRVTSDK